MGRRDEPVRRLLLPADGPGHADSVACGVDACWIGGDVAGRAVLWRLDTRPDVRRAERVVIAPVAVDPGTSVWAMLGGGPGVVVARDGRTRWVRGQVETDGPPGIPIAVARTRSAGPAVIIDRGGSRTLWTARFGA